MFIQFGRNLVHALNELAACGMKPTAVYWSRPAASTLPGHARRTSFAVPVPASPATIDCMRSTPDLLRQSAWKSKERMIYETLTAPMAAAAETLQVWLSRGIPASADDNHTMSRIFLVRSVTSSLVTSQIVAANDGSHLLNGRKAKRLVFVAPTIFRLPIDRRPLEWPCRRWKEVFTFADRWPWFLPRTVIRRAMSVPTPNLL